MESGCEESESQFCVLTDPDRQRPVFAAHRAAAVGTTGFGGAAIFLLLLEDFWVEFLHRSIKIHLLVDFG